MLDWRHHPDPFELAYMSHLGRTAHDLDRFLTVLHCRFLMVPPVHMAPNIVRTTDVLALLNWTFDNHMASMFLDSLHSWLSHRYFLHY